jgi:hypothetical protein
MTRVAWIMTLLFFTAPAMAEGMTSTPPVWAIDPGRPGPDLPPRGRSLFDELYTANGSYRLPFPFSSVVAQLRMHMKSGGTDPVRQVLIPMGRSLVRNAGAPDFFRYPRLVVAVDGESRAGEPLLRDRIYLGYHEKAGVIEAISYNEEAGRFEYQVVRNYRPGAVPRVVYAQRGLCLACHQNAAPIFSRPLWDETAANDSVRQRLKAEHRDFYGAPLDIGVDIPSAVDDATSRASLLNVYQFLWREACGGATPEAVRCRAAAVKFALQYRLSGDLDFDHDSAAWREILLPTLHSVFLSRWHGGLAIPDAHIPNRNPLTSAITAESDPLRQRPPMAVWGADTAAANLVSGVADFFSARDIASLDAALSRQAASTRNLAAECAVEQRNTDSENRFSLNCQPKDAAGFGLRGRVFVRAGRVVRGTLDALELPGQPALASVEVTAGTAPAGALHFGLRRDGRNVRSVSAQRVIAIDVQITPTSSHATLQLRDEFGMVDSTLDVMVRSRAEALAGPIRHAALVPALFAGVGIPHHAAAAQKYSPAQTDIAPSTGHASNIVTEFRAHCGLCHDTQEAFPPNFLHGEEAQVQTQLSHCAERIYYRLSMWKVDEAARERTPMPPATALQMRGISIDAWTHGTALAKLKQHAGLLLGAHAPGVLARPFDTLAPCLPAHGGT